MSKLTVETIENLPMDKPEAWDIMCQGKTLGLFQLESNLGRHWAKLLQPRKSDDCAALISLMRPGCLKAFSIDEDGKNKNMMELFVDRHHGVSSVSYVHDSVKDILSYTYGVMVYQEQLLEMVKRLAGLSLQEADIFRKSIGKKNAKELSAALDWFVSGCAKTKIVDDKLAREIADMMWSSSRYSFNKSHAAGYAKLAYWSAWCKANYPLEFFCQYLRTSKDFKEIRSFVNDAHMNHIEIRTPDIRSLKKHFYIKESYIYYGLTNIRDVGEKVVNKLRNSNINFEELNEFTVLTKLYPLLDKKSINAFIHSGALDYLKVPRVKLAYDYSKWSRLTDKEQLWVSQHDFKTLLDALLVAHKVKKEGGAAHDIRRNKVLESVLYSVQKPPMKLVDTQTNIMEKERLYLGCSLTFPSVETDIEPNCTCQEYFDGKQMETYVMTVCITNVSIQAIKNGKNKGRQMAFLEVSDETGWIDSIVVFSDAFELYEPLLVEQNFIAIKGKRGPKGLIVQKIKQL